MGNRRIALLTLSTTILLFLMGGLLFGRLVPGNSIYKYLPLFQRINTTIRGEYVEEVQEDQLLEGAVRGMVNPLDPETSLLQAGETLEKLSKEPAPGVVVVRRSGFAYVLDVADPAITEVQAGDYLRHIDGHTTAEMDQGAILRALSGPPGTTVEVLAFKPGEAPRRVTLKRTTPPLDDLPKALADRPGWWFWQPRLLNRPWNEVEEALAAVPQEDQLILDLRHCQADPSMTGERLAALFLAEGDILAKIQNDKDQELSTRLQENTPSVFAKERVVIWAGPRTLRAGEVAAAALSRAGVPVIGKASGGQAFSRQEFPLADGRTLELVVGHYTNSKDQPMAKESVTPTVEIDSEDDEAFWAGTLKPNAEAA